MTNLREARDLIAPATHHQSGRGAMLLILGAGLMLLISLALAGTDPQVDAARLLQGSHSPTPTVLPTATLPPLLFNVSTQDSYEIYTLPASSSERLVAAAAGFSPHIAGANAERTWIYIYFFTPDGLQAGWMRRSRITLDDSALNDLPLIDPANPPALPALEYSEQAVPIHLREAIIQATTDASAIAEIFVTARNGTDCASADGSVLREGDTVYFSFASFMLTRDEAESVRWQVRVNGRLVDQSQITYVVESDVAEASGEWILPFRIWAYVAWTAQPGTNRIRANGTGEGIRHIECVVQVEERPWLRTPTPTPTATATP